MSLLRPATPGFVVTLTATILLAVVVFCVPYFKSIFFLKAAFTQGDISGYITLGTLGYCFNDGSNTTCSKPSVGYEFDPNKLLGNKLPVQIPELVVKWLTYALVLHVVALGFAGVATVFGLLAHIREASMACCSTCFSGTAAAITLLAFIFDLAFFFVARGRINKIQGGSAVIGNAIWLTLAAWLLLFFAGCFFSVGRCCIGTRYDGPSGRKRRRGDPDDAPNKAMPSTYNENSATDLLRLDAIKAEADRKAQAAAAPREQGLPAFEEYERRPLRQQYIDEDELYSDPRGPGAAAAGLGVAPTAGGVSNVRREPSGYSDHTASSGAGRRYPGGYSSGTPGTRAVDGYYNTPAAAPAQQPYRSATASPPSLGQSYPVGAVYGAATTPVRQPSQSYADRFAPQTTAYADPYSASHPHDPLSNPHAQYETGHTQYTDTIPASNYHEATSSHLLAPSSYSTTNHAAALPSYPIQQYPHVEEQNDNRTSPQAPSPTAGPLSSYPSRSETLATVNPSQAAAHYGPRAIPSTSPRRGPGETSAIATPHNWNTSATVSDHHMSQEESPPEYNPYEDAPPPIPAALSAGGPLRSEKHY